ncbi:MAG: DMT family transporter [Kofleriaceae bacterium]
MVAGLIMVTLAAASWGTWSLFLRPTGMPASVTAPLMFAVMGLVTLPLALRGPRAVWNRGTIGLVLANAAFDAGNVLTFFAALWHTTVPIAVLSHYLAPILIALAAPYIDGIRTPGTRPAALIALIGLVIILEPWRSPTTGATLGAALGVASAFCYAGNLFTVRRLVTRIGAVRAMSYHSLIAAAVLAPLLIGQAPTVSASGVGLLAAGAMTIGAGSGVVFAIGLSRIGSARAAVLTFAEPLVAVAVGALVWEEPLHLAAALGGALVLGAGIYVAHRGSS